MLIIPSSWGCQLDGALHHQHRAASSSFLAPLLRRKKKASARGVSHAYPLLCFNFCFILFLLASFYKKHKKLVSFIVVISLILVCYVVP
jgi:lipopolysaccharide export LptBFGC system permease protein LptF